MQLPIVIIVFELFLQQGYSQTLSPLFPSSLSEQNNRLSQVDITPVPFDDYSPQLNEFRRIDANSDQKILFSEFILADRPYIEERSRVFHQQDLNGDGVISKDEFLNYYRKKIEVQRAKEQQAENFFRQLEIPFNNPFALGFPQSSFFMPPSRPSENSQKNLSPSAPALSESRINGTSISIIR